MPVGPRVLFFEAYPFAFTGAQRQLLRLMRGLADRGWSVRLATPADGVFPEQAREAGVVTEVVELPAALMIYGRQTTGTKGVAAAAALPAVWVRLARWLKSRADVVHVCDHRGQLLLGPAARIARLPTVWHIEAIDQNRALNEACSRLASQVVVPSRAVAEGLPGLRIRGNLSVVANTIDPAWLDLPARTPPTQPTVVTVGRLHPDKGIDVLLGAMVLLRRRVPLARAVVVGGEQSGYEGYRATLVDLRHRLDLDDAVDLTGPLDRPQTVLLGATAYVQPSRDRTELQPLAVMEAMAVGLPIVATGVGGVPEMLDGGRLGLLVPPEDERALADALAQVLEDPILAERLGRAARSRARELASVERMVDRFERIYRSFPPSPAR